MKVLFRPLAIVFVGAITSGCNTTLSPTVSINSEAANIPPAPLPKYLEGDRVYYKKGAKERAIEVTDQTIKWKRSSIRNYVTWRNFIFPRAASESRRNLGDETIKESTPPDILWPLKVGNTAQFSTYKRTTSRTAGNTKYSMRFWNCIVTEASNITALVGSFDAYRVECFRSNELNKPSRHFVWYYAPELGHPIVKVSYRKNMKFPPKVEEVLAVKRGLKWLTSDERRSLRKKLDSVLEYVPSGKSRTWRSWNGRTRVTITPTNSLRASNGAYCRNYKQKITYGKLKQTAAGVMCRKGKERWAVPRDAWKKQKQNLFSTLKL
jgi:surface antigen